jgi:arylsulfatase A-like enzyme
MPFPSPRTAPTWLVASALLALGCPAPDDTAAGDPIDTVVIITVDALSPRMLWGNDGQWETAPQLWSFFDESVVLPNVLTPRGLTAVALTSLSTGTYPRDHGLRANSSASRPRRATLPERFQAAGYRTMGYSANLCYVWDHGVDERVCTWSGEDTELGGLAERDDALIEQLVQRLPELPDDQKVFLWVHLNQPHKPFVAVDTYYEQFHPEAYNGNLNTADVDQTYNVAMGLEPFDDLDRRHMEAVYASQVRAVDDNVGRVLDALDAIGRYDDALIVFGADHSEELAEHHNFFYHGCPPYNDTLGVTFALRAPERLPQGVQLDTWVSNTDIAPTIAELADAFTWDGHAAGRSLVASMQAGRIDPEPIYFERGVQTAGVIDGDDKYIMSGTEGTDQCKPYDELGGAYPGELEELYDLASDPGELSNVVQQHPTTRDTMRSEVCSWIQESDWVDWDEVSDNLLLEQCDTWAAR